VNSAITSAPRRAAKGAERPELCVMFASFTG
jgi:hypothetical protein